MGRKSWRPWRSNMSLISPEDIIERVSNLKPPEQDGQRAPHRPLLLLLAISRMVNGKERLALFSELEGPMKDLLREFGPPRKVLSPELPFWHLQSDGLWEVPRSDDLARRKGKDRPLKSEYYRHRTRGGLPQDVFDVLKGDGDLRKKIVVMLLEEDFPPQRHEALVRALGLDPSEMLG